MFQLCQRNHREMQTTFSPSMKLGTPLTMCGFRQISPNTYFWTEWLSAAGGPRVTAEKTYRNNLSVRLQRARHLPFPLTVTAADGDTEHHEVENRPLVFALAEDDGSQLNSAVQQATPPTPAPPPSPPSPSETEVMLQVTEEWQMEWMKNKREIERKKRMAFLKQRVNILRFFFCFCLMLTIVFMSLFCQDTIWKLTFLLYRVKMHMYNVIHLMQICS